MIEEIKKDLEPVKPLKLDFGCGKNKISSDHIGVDSIAFPGVDLVLNLCEKESSIQLEDFTIKNTYKSWPWEDNSVDEAHCSHFLEHLNAEERIHFVNELYRVLKVGSKCTIIVPDFSSCRAYGDLTHVWPPVSAFWLFYLNESWRADNAPHNDKYKCNFAAGWGFSMHQSLLVKNQEYQTFALQFFKEAAQDLIATITKYELGVKV